MSARGFSRAAVIVATIGLYACVNIDVDAAHTSNDCSAPVTQGSVVDEIHALEKAGSESNTVGMPLEKGERMYWPEYVAVSPDGKLTSKADMIADWRPKPWASSFKIQDLQIRVHCDSAIVIGLSEALWIGAPADAKPVHFRWLNVWTRRNGEWRMSATQFARF